MALVQLKEKVYASMFNARRPTRASIALLSSAALLLSLGGAASGFPGISTMSDKQESQQRSEPLATPPAAKPEDVASMDAILAALYDVISGPAGKKRDWNRMRSLFIPGARLIPVGKGKDGTWAAEVMDVEAFIKNGEEYFEKNSFFEREAARRTEQYGHIAHVFSTYESRHKADDPKPFQRGINSFQLVNDGKRWWVVTIFWEGETNMTPLPEKYLKSAP